MPRMPKSVTIQFTLDSCRECRHLDHSGAFTPGGAKPICGNRAACAIRGKEAQEAADAYNQTGDQAALDKFHWKHRVLPPTLEIPDWCPLKRGAAY